jgi:transposase
MGKPLSTDLRSRLIDAVAGGLSRRAAAERFGVSAASAVRWVHAANTRGGATLRYLPPHSPDFNPIENAFSKLKAILRKAAARTIEHLWGVIRDALPQFTPDECANYFTAAGYEPDRSDFALGP